MKPPKFLQTVAAALLLAFLGTTAPAVTLPPTDDTYSTLTYTTAHPPVLKSTSLASATGARGSLAVSRTHTAFIRFNAAGALAGTTVLKATLTLYFPLATTAGALDLHLVTSNWHEKFTGAAVAQPMYSAS